MLSIGQRKSQKNVSGMSPFKDRFKIFTKLHNV